MGKLSDPRHHLDAVASSASTVFSTICSSLSVAVDGVKQLAVLADNLDRMDTVCGPVEVRGCRL